MMKNAEGSKRNKTVSGKYDESNPVETSNKPRYQGHYFNENQKCGDIRNTGDIICVRDSKTANIKDTADPEYTKVQEVEMKDDSYNTLTETDEFLNINKTKSCSKGTKITKDIQFKTVQKEQIGQHSSQIISKPKYQNDEQATKLTSCADGSDGGSHHEARDRNLSRQKSQVQTTKTRCRDYSPTGFQFGFFILTISG